MDVTDDSFSLAVSLKKAFMPEKLKKENITFLLKGVYILTKEILIGEVHI